MHAIEIRDLDKSFGEKQVLRGLNLTVPKGEIYGFIGENGSGKSTTEKIICGLLPYQNGSVTLFGKPLSDKTANRKIGALIETAACFPSLTVYDNLLLQAKNLGIANARKEIVKTLDLVGMTGAAGNLFKNCSLGMKQRVGIATAFLGDPDLLVLDEPINALDADGVRIVREALLDFAARGKTVLVSSHILGELEKIATRYGIIRNGSMLEEKTAKELLDGCPEYVALKSGDKQKTKALLERQFFRVQEDDKEYLRVYDAKSPQQVASYLYENGIVVSELKKAKIDLEEYYLQVSATRQ